MAISLIIRKEENMKNLFKVISVVIIACMALAAFAACQTSAPSTTTAAETKGTETKAAETTAAATEAETTAAETQTEAIETETTEEVTTEAETEPEETGDVIKIGTREELFAFADNILNGDEDYSDKTIKLTADINLDPTLEGGKNWIPLGTDQLYDAVIDGDGHVINGMTITPDDLEVAGNDGKVYGSGFIGISNSSITIKNITFTNALINSDTKHCGCVIGSVEGAGNYVELDHVTVSNLTLNGGVGVDGDINGISFRVGGLVGANIAGANLEIHDCSIENSKLFGFHNLGGILGNSNEGMYEVTNCSVKNVELNYSAGYATNEKYQVAADIRYFADIFYNVNNYWGEYHTDFDKENGNKYENIDSYDVKFDIHYKDEEGKSADYPAEDGIYPTVGGSVIRPRDERGY